MCIRDRDLAANRKGGAPKAAQRAAPAGSVYWYDKLADVEALKALLHNGLSLTDTARRAEGYNHCTIAPWACLLYTSRCV